MYGNPSVLRNVHKIQFSFMPRSLKFFSFNSVTLRMTGFLVVPALIGYLGSPPADFTPAA